MRLAKEIPKHQLLALSTTAPKITVREAWSTPENVTKPTSMLPLQSVAGYVAISKKRKLIVSEGEEEEEVTVNHTDSAHYININKRNKVVENNSIEEKDAVNENCSKFGFTSYKDELEYDRYNDKSYDATHAKSTIQNSVSHDENGQSESQGRQSPCPSANAGPSPNAEKRVQLSPPTSLSSAQPEATAPASGLSPHSNITTISNDQPRKSSPATSPDRVSSPSNHLDSNDHPPANSSENMLNRYSLHQLNSAEVIQTVLKKDSSNITTSSVLLSSVMEINEDDKVRCFILYDLCLILNNNFYSFNYFIFFLSFFNI